MRLRWLWSIVAVLACSTLPPKPTSLTPLDCLARDDCYVIRVDNVNNQYTTEIKANGIRLGIVQSYSNDFFPLWDNYLIEGNCVIISAKFTELPNRPTIYSSKECIHPGQYLSLNIASDPFNIWLTPFRTNK